VRMIWWFVMVAAAAGAVVWAVLSAYIQVRDRIRRAENRRSEPGHETEAGPQH
jgi:hypothetical protein